MLTSSEEIAQPCVSLKINDKRELKEMYAILLSRMEILLWNAQEMYFFFHLSLALFAG